MTPEQEAAHTPAAAFEPWSEVEGDLESLADPTPDHLINERRAQVENAEALRLARAL